MTKDEILVARDALGLTMLELAGLLGIERSDVARWGMGYNPTIAVMSRAYSVIAAAADAIIDKESAPLVRRDIPAHFGCPPCATSAEYDHWREVARHYPPGKGGFCADCTAVYQSQHIRAGTCQNPGFLFSPDKEEDCV